MRVLYPHGVGMIIAWMRAHVAQKRVLPQEGSQVGRGTDLEFIRPAQYRHKVF